MEIRFTVEKIYYNGKKLWYYTENNGTWKNYGTIVNVSYYDIYFFGKVIAQNMYI